jgi:hypothetical protein
MSDPVIPALVPDDSSWRDGLVEHANWDCPVFASPDAAPARVAELGARTSAAWRYLSEVLGYTPRPKLLILSEADWAPRSPHPVYGMPNADEDDKLFVAASVNDFWREFADLAALHAPDHMPALQAAYGNGSAIPELELGRFFDLLAVHELVHIFFTGPVRLPRWWVEELACNLLLHCYVAAREPGALPGLTALPAAIASMVAQHDWYQALADFEIRYAYDMDPVNYGWYQCRLHVAAARLHDTGGAAVARSLWDELGPVTAAGRIGSLSDAEVITLLDAASPAFGDIARDW